MLVGVAMLSTTLLVRAALGEDPGPLCQRQWVITTPSGSYEGCGTPTLPGTLPPVPRPPWWLDEYGPVPQHPPFPPDFLEEPEPG